MDAQEEKDLTSEDRIYSSRKFVLAIICIVVIALGGLLAIKSMAFAGVYSMFIGGILGVAGLYITGNVANDFLNNKVKATVQVQNIKTNGASTKETTTVEGPDVSVADLQQNGE